MGWYMVKSGLDPKIVENKDVPRVSQYRLAAHLSLAFFIYVMMLKEGLAHLKPKLLFPLYHSVPNSKYIFIASIYNRFLGLGYDYSQEIQGGYALRDEAYILDCGHWCICCWFGCRASLQHIS